MKIFLSALEGSEAFDYINERIDRYLYNLMSFYYLTKNDNYKEILRKSEKVLIDSGAHSFQKGKRVKWYEYTESYAEWIKKHDCDKILGYFEMDVDNVIGYEKVLELRKILLKATNKIIPVWHKNRGIEDYIDMCKNYEFDIVAISGFKNEDIVDSQYQRFVNVAHKYGKKIHGLGLTRIDILDKVNFDSVDSSTWLQGVVYGRIDSLRFNKRVSRRFSKEFAKENRKEIMYIAYLEAMEMQRRYLYK
jgi:hypothetical protein